jgi:hypothetical protein
VDATQKAQLEKVTIKVQVSDGPPQQVPPQTKLIWGSTAMRALPTTKPQHGTFAESQGSVGMP